MEYSVNRLCKFLPNHYTYIYLLPRGSLKELIDIYQEKSRYSEKEQMTSGKLPDMISMRSDQRSRRSFGCRTLGRGFNHGQGHRSAIGSIVERKTRTVILVKLKAKMPSVRKAFEKN
ncbi:MAG: hypothetical protein IPI10_17935 [Bacteroidetes bacterium]|nr:hypothetical protein [Bacteroidota bacterium]